MPAVWKWRTHGNYWIWFEKVIPISKPIKKKNLFQVPKSKDELVEREFNRLLEATSYLSHCLDITQVDSSGTGQKHRPISLGQALELIIRMQEQGVKKKQVLHLKSVFELQNDLIQNQETVHFIF